MASGTASSHSAFMVMDVARVRDALMSSKALRHAGEHLDHSNAQAALSFRFI